MARKTKKMICLAYSLLFIFSHAMVTRSEALPEVMEGTATLADNIMTYYALSGSAVANSDWINTLYSSYGSSFGTIEELAQEGYLVLNDAGMWEPVQELGQMIEQAPAYSSLGLNEMFNVSAQEAAAGGGFAAASGGSILAGSLGGVASTGVVPLLGGVTAAYWGGIAIGTLINHIKEKYHENVLKNAQITASQEALAQVPEGGRLVEFLIYQQRYHCYCTMGPDVYPYRIRSTLSEPENYWEIFVQNAVNDTRSYKYWNYTGTSSTNDLTRFGSRVLGYTFVDGAIGFETVPAVYADRTAFQNAVKNGNYTPSFTNKSPDLIGENGNLEGEYTENGGYDIPDMLPQIDPGVQAGKPLTLQDWQNFANAVQNNNNNTSPIGSPDNQGLFDNILDLIRTVIPENVPNPNPNPDPYSPPVVTPVPDPAYPDPVPDQQITENPQESENPQQTENPIDTGKPWRLPDLRNKFPFCIPWDIGKIFSKLKINARQAPHISWRFNPPNTPIDYTFNLDLEDFEEVATLLRTLELMGFIVGLAFVTRYLIGAN